MRQAATTTAYRNRPKASLWTIVCTKNNKPDDVLVDASRVVMVATTAEAEAAGAATQRVVIIAVTIFVSAASAALGTT